MKAAALTLLIAIIAAAIAAQGIIVERGAKSLARGVIVNRGAGMHLSQGVIVDRR